MYKKAFCTPLVVQRNGREELISPGASWIYAYEPDTGKELWKLNYGRLGFSNVPRPLLIDDTIYICSCYMKSSLMAIDLSQEGPITDENVKWSFDKQMPNMPSPVEADGAIYLVNDRGIATCLDAETGKAFWQARLEGGFSSSPLFADGKIYFGNQDGELFVVKPNREQLEILAKNQLDSQIMASPAALDEALFVRTAKSLYRFENK